jgi:hypothetical protein
MIERGELMFSTLAWFQHYEDEQRGDRFEGTNKYFPIGGLEVTRHERNGKLHAPVKFTLAGMSLQSRATAHKHIFIYSTSLAPRLAFEGANACVEIFDPSRFLSKLQSALERVRAFKSNTLIHDAVKYYAFSAPPENVYALPHLLTLHKHTGFVGQHEYRFAFGIRTNVFNFEHVDCFLLREDETLPLAGLEPTHHRKLVRLGSLNDCCRML